MTIGAGRYDNLSTWVRKRAEAKAVVVIVVGGNKGSGFSVQVQGGYALHLPELLRTLADTIEKDLGTPERFK